MESYSVTIVIALIWTRWAPLILLFLPLTLDKDVPDSYLIGTHNSYQLKFEDIFLECHLHLTLYSNVIYWAELVFLIFKNGWKYICIFLCICMYVFTMKYFRFYHRWLYTQYHSCFSQIWYVWMYQPDLFLCPNSIFDNQLLYIPKK